MTVWASRMRGADKRNTAEMRQAAFRAGAGVVTKIVESDGKSPNRQIVKSGW